MKLYYIKYNIILILIYSNHTLIKYPLMIFFFRTIILQLENLSINLEKTINELSVMNEKIYKNKQELKTKITKIFTKLRNALNLREDKILSAASVSVP